MKSNRKRDRKRREHLPVAGVGGREVARVERGKKKLNKKTIDGQRGKITEESFWRRY